MPDCLHHKGVCCWCYMRTVDLTVLAQRVDAILSDFMNWLFVLWAMIQTPDGKLYLRGEASDCWDNVLQQSVERCAMLGFSCQVLSVMNVKIDSRRIVTLYSGSELAVRGGKWAHWGVRYRPSFDLVKGAASGKGAERIHIYVAQAVLLGLRPLLNGPLKLGL